MNFESKVEKYLREEYNNTIFKLKVNGNGKMEKAIGYGAQSCAACKHSKTGFPGVKRYCENEKVYSAMGVGRKNDPVPEDVVVGVADEGSCKFFE